MVLLEQEVDGVAEVVTLFSWMNPGVSNAASTMDRPRLGSNRVIPGVRSAWGWATLCSQTRAFSWSFMEGSSKANPTCSGASRLGVFTAGTGPSISCIRLLTEMRDGGAGGLEGELTVWSLCPSQRSPEASELSPPTGSVSFTLAALVLSRLFSWFRRCSHPLWK